MSAIQKTAHIDMLTPLEGAVPQSPLPVTRGKSSKSVSGISDSETITDGDIKLQVARVLSGIRAVRMMLTVSAKNVWLALKWLLPYVMLSGSALLLVSVILLAPPISLPDRLTENGRMILVAVLSGVAFIELIFGVTVLIRQASKSTN